MFECAGGNSVKAHCSAAGDAIIQQETTLSIQPKETEGTPPTTWSPYINSVLGSIHSFFPAADLYLEIST